MHKAISGNFLQFAVEGIFKILSDPAWHDYELELARAQSAGPVLICQFKSF